MIKHIIILLSIFIFVGCAKNQVNTNQKGIGMIDNINLATYQEYIKQKKFILNDCNKYDKDELYKTTYLKDGTKIYYHCCKDSSSGIYEKVTSSQYPFVRVSKIYFCDTKTLKSTYIAINNLLIMPTQSFDKTGKLIEEKKPSYSANANYQIVLDWAEKEGFLDLKNEKILKGHGFELYYTPVKDLPNEYYSNITQVQREEISKHQGIWFYTEINTPGHIGYKQDYILSDKGIYIGKGMKEAIMPGDQMGS